MLQVAQLSQQFLSEGDALAIRECRHVYRDADLWHIERRNRIADTRCYERAADHRHVGAQRGDLGTQIGDGIGEHAALVGA